MTDAIERVEAALGRDDLREALSLTVARWQQSRDATLAAVVDSLSRRAARAFEPPVERTNGGFQKKWLEVIATKDPVAVAWLAESLPTRMAAGAPDEPFKKRLAAIRKHGVDPRFAEALTRIVEARTNLARWCDDDIAKTLKVVGDARARGALKAFGEKSWAGVLDRLEIAPLDAGERRRWEALVPSAGPSRAKALAASVAASPDDDAERAVLADALQLEDDPRGEFIALQIAEAEGKATPASVKRADELLAKHKKAWLGGLLPVTERARFTRGFVSDLTLVPTWKAKDAAWKKYAADEALATVESIENGKTKSATLALFLASPAMKSLRTLILDDKIVYEAIRERPPATVREVVSTGWGKQPLATYEGVVLPLIERLPNLERVTAVPSLLGALAKTKGFERISSILLRQESDDDDAIDPFAVLGDLPAHVKTVRLGSFWAHVPAPRFLHGARDFVDVHRAKDGAFSVDVKLIGRAEHEVENELPPLIKAATRQKDVRSFRVRATDKKLLEAAKKVVQPLAKKGVAIDVGELPARSGLVVGLGR